MLILTIFIIMLIYIYIKSKKYTDKFVNYKSITVTPQSMLYNSININTWYKDSLYWNLGNNLKSIYPIEFNNQSYSPLNNIIKVEENKNHLSLIQQDYLLNYLSNKPNSNIRLITTIGIEDITLIIPSNSSILSWKDLKFKKIGTLSKESGSYFILDKLNSILDLNSKITNFDKFNSDTIIESLTNKSIDAFFIIISNPSPIIRNISINYSIRIIGTFGINSDIIKHILPYYNKSYIDTTDYKLISINSIETYKTNISLICNKDFDPLESYILIKSIFTNFSYLINNGNKDYKLQLYDFNPSYLYSNYDKIKLHEGVIRFLNDINIITNNPNTECLYKVGIDKCNIKNVNNNRLLI